MLSLNSVSVIFGDRILFDNVSFQIQNGEKISLVGKNGAGKSTMLKTIIGDERLNGGSVSFPKDYKIGYLPQEMLHKDNEDVYTYLREANNEVIQLNQRLDQINDELNTRTDYTSNEYNQLLFEQSHVIERIHILDDENIDFKINQILVGLGFDKNDYYKKISEFSGGWKMKVEIAKLLIQKPDLLLFDEPTNHLDIESISWLENFLKDSSSSLILISHDRRFMDNITNRTLEINNSKIYDYKLKYSDYKIQRQEEIEEQKKQKKNQENEIKQTKMLIDKFRAKANKAAFAQNLIKKLDKTEIIEVDDNDLSSIKLKIPEAIRSGKKVCEININAKSYKDKKIFGNTNALISQGEKISLVGKNGMGKSTLIRMIMGDDRDFDGEINIGASVKIGYFAQDSTKQLDEDITIFDTIDQLVNAHDNINVRNVLGSFLFTKDDVDKKVKVLSGGEKTRLSLCKLLLEPRNFLILDEPTNHLDIKSKEVLKIALQQFEGTLLIVSHDRDFLDNLCTKVYEIGDYSIKDHHFDINEYIELIKSKNEQEINNISQVVEPTIIIEKTSNDWELNKEVKKLKNKSNQLEKKIESLEKNIKFEEEKLSKNPTDTNLINSIENMYKELELNMIEWEDIAKKIN